MRLANRSFLFSVIVGALHIPQGTGRRKVTSVIGEDHSLFKKHSVVTINNDDNLCLARAIDVCSAHHCIVSDDEWKTLKTFPVNKNKSNLDILFHEKKTSR